MLNYEAVLQRAEILFWERQLCWHGWHGFRIYDHYGAVEDALEEALPGWKKFEDFLRDFGQLHDGVLASEINHAFQDRAPCGDAIIDVLRRERQELRYTLSQALRERIGSTTLNLAIEARYEEMRRANQNIASQPLVTT